MAEGSGVKTAPVATGAAAAAFEALTQQVGQEVHVSDWLTITQDRINAFAAATDDPTAIRRLTIAVARSARALAA